MKRLRGRLTKFKVAVSVLVVALVVLVCKIGYTWYEIEAINRKLDNLYWIAENTHSGFVYVMIPKVELSLRQRLSTLTTLLTITILVLGLLTCVIAVKYKVSLKQCSASVFLIFILLTPTVNGQVVRDAKRLVQETTQNYYSRVEMTVSPGSRLNTVDGYITPHFDGTAEPVLAWVCYHIGFAYEESPLEPAQWLAGGYTVDEYEGIVFYIEWCVGGAYGEVYKEGVSLGGKYAVHAFPYTKALIIYDACDGLFPILSKMCPGLPDQDENLMTCAAGGESLYESNRMGAGFSKLEWSQTGGYTRYWDGNRFPCSIIHDDPYSLEISAPYYDFTVSGGTGKILSISNNVPTVGSTDPPTGVYTYRDGRNVLATAYGYEGGYVTYEFYHWLLDDDVAIYENPYIVTMDTDHTLKAYFKYSSGAGGGGIPPRPYDPP